MRHMTESEYENYLKENVGVPEELFSHVSFNYF